VRFRTTNVHTFCPPSSAARGGANEPPLSEIARANNPFAAGAVASMLAAMPPDLANPVDAGQR